MTNLLWQRDSAIDNPSNADWPEEDPRSTTGTGTGTGTGTTEDWNLKENNDFERVMVKTRDGRRARVAVQWV